MKRPWGEGQPAPPERLWQPVLLHQSDSEAEEWLPASAALPSDVPDTKAALEYYSLLAEYLVAMRHTEVPSVFLGQVLVRHLGGQWIPRKKLEEAQVRVGQRVWLPFVRAHRYLRSRQALLDSSLTQLYRVAERHRG